MITARNRKARNVILFSLARYGYDRDVWMAINEYALIHGPWRLLDLGHHNQRLLPKILAQGAHGVIAEVANQGVADLLRNTKLPLVNINAPLAVTPPIPSAGPDYAAAGAMVGRRFRELGFGRITFVGIARWPGELEALAGLQDDLSAAGKPAPDSIWEADNGSWGFINYIREAPKPLALAAANDNVGRRLCDYCLEAGASVPEEAAIISIGNLDVFCETAHPPLSSVELPNRQVGLAAAEMLDTLMRGRELRSVNVRLPPLGIVSRPSSDTLAVDDRALVRAMRYIREHVGQEIAVSRLCREAGTNRRYLERKFRTFLNSTPAQEIYKSRLRRAQELLRQTRLPMDEVAARAGFRDATHLGVSFRKTLDTTPTAYRRQWGG